MTDSPLRAMFRTALRQMTVLLVVLGVASCLVGYLVAGMPGLWGGVLGTGLVALFTVTTAVIMLLTADRPVYVASAALVGSWLLKVVVVFVVLLLVRGQDFYDPLVFFITLVVAILGSLAIEMSAALRARVPHIDPGAGVGDEPGAGVGDDPRAGERDDAQP